jgi:hypothetical protein
MGKMTLLAANLPELTYWENQGFTDHDIDESYANTPADLKIVKYIWDGGKSVRFITKDEEMYNKYTTILLLFLENVISNSQLPPFSILASTHDSIWCDNSRKFPVFCFNKPATDNNALMLPDPFYIISNGYLEPLANIHKTITELSWEGRVAGVYWRGRTTGFPNLTKEHWRENQRIKLCLLAKEINDPQLLDASIVEICQCEDEETKKMILDSGIISQTVEMNDFCRYRYQLDIDGNCSAWGLFWKLFIGPVFKVESSNIQWFHRSLKPWEHFIPVKSDLSDLAKLIEWARANDEECQFIHRNAMKLVLDNNIDQTIASAGILLQRLAAAKR